MRKPLRLLAAVVGATTAVLLVTSLPAQAVITQDQFNFQGNFGNQNAECLSDQTGFCDQSALFAQSNDTSQSETCASPLTTCFQNEQSLQGNFVTAPGGFPGQRLEAGGTPNVDQDSVVAQENTSFQSELCASPPLGFPDLGPSGCGQSMGSLQANVSSQGSFQG